MWTGSLYLVLYNPLSSLESQQAERRASRKCWAAAKRLGLQLSGAHYGTTPRTLRTMDANDLGPSSILAK
jgi:hypothetical protein